MWAGSLTCPIRSARGQGLAVSVRALANLFLGFRPAEADFSYFCAEITRHTIVPLRGSLPSSQLSCVGIPLEMLLVGPEEGICPGQASVLTVICPGVRRHPLQIWIAKETCLKATGRSGTTQCSRYCPAWFVSEAGAAGSSAYYCLNNTWLLESLFPWTSDHRCRSKQIFLGCKGFLPKFFQTCPKRFCATFADRVSVWPFTKWSSLVFLQTLEANFFKSSSVGRHFCPNFQGFFREIWGFCSDFQGFCRNFQGFCPNFQQTKILGSALAPAAPPPPTPLPQAEATLSSHRKTAFICLQLDRLGMQLAWRNLVIFIWINQTGTLHRILERFWERWQAQAGSRYSCPQCTSVLPGTAIICLSRSYVDQNAHQLLLHMRRRCWRLTKIRTSSISNSVIFHAFPPATISLYWETSTHVSMPIHGPPL